VIYKAGALRISEGLPGSCPTSTVHERRVHIRDGKGAKDRYVPMPALTLESHAVASGRLTAIPAFAVPQFRPQPIFIVRIARHRMDCQRAGGRAVQRH